MAISNNSTGLRPGVCTSTTRPSAPYEGQHIYETDTDLVYLWNGTAWVETVSALTKAPRGIISVTSITSSSLDVSSETLHITSPSFTAVANRYYKITYYVPVFQYAAGTVNQIAMRIRLTNTAGAEQQVTEIRPLNTVTGGNLQGTCTIVKTLTAGSTVFVATFAPSGGGTARSYGAGTSASQLVIEDIGAS